MRTKSNAQSPTDNSDRPLVLFLPSLIQSLDRPDHMGRLSLNSSLWLERELHFGPLLRVIQKTSEEPVMVGKGTATWRGDGGVSGRLPGSCRAT